ncbi:MAG: UDP-N-acetylmuramoyl-L-alanyl-D-glutamate--2,6-diaminopimelate ligase, partial [Actinomycetota bacterium]|nr:UDP-N-acetylmuramoyl-L-alanyl-D-glutamate--2,6-diaminopimelate ligase [Actinomycetota bacterium]
MAAEIPETTVGDLARSLGELVVEVDGDAQTPVRGIAYNSSQVEPGTLFCCVPGMVVDGHEFAPDAVSRGAVALCTSRRLDLGV